MNATRHERCCKVRCMSRWCAAGLAAFLLNSVSLQAQVIVDASNSGFYLNTGIHGANTQNPFTGQDGTITMFQHNGFFTFNLPVFTGPVVAGTFRLGVENYYGPDSSEAVTLYDVSTLVPVLNASHIDAVDVYTDLMTGKVYGSASIQKTDKGHVIEFDLNPQALADLTSASGKSFAIGLHLDNIGSSGTEGILWDRAGEPTVHELRLTAVPDAGRSAMLLAGSVTALLLLSRCERSSREDRRDVANQPDGHDSLRRRR